MTEIWINGSEEAWSTFELFVNNSQYVIKTLVNFKPLIKRFEFNGVKRQIILLITTSYQMGKNVNTLKTKSHQGTL